MVLELLAQLTRRVERVVLDDDGAESQHRVEGHDVLRAVRQHDGHRIAGADAEVPQPRRRAVDRCLQLCVCRLTPEELQRGGIGVVPRRRGDDVDE